MMRQEKLGKLEKNSITSSGLETATFRLVTALQPSTLPRALGLEIKRFVEMKTLCFTLHSFIFFIPFLKLRAFKERSAPVHFVCSYVRN
jgi:hypothetical protein